MKLKKEIVENWLPRYTGEKLENFGEYILLTNFSQYISLFAKIFKVKAVDLGKPFQCVTAEKITLINFGMGSPGAATIMDLLSAINPKGVLFLGKCGGLKKRNNLGDLNFANRGNKRRRNIKRLFSAGSACDACVCFAKSYINNDS